MIHLDVQQGKLSQESIRERLEDELAEGIDSLIWQMEQATGLKVTSVSLGRFSKRVSVTLYKEIPLAGGFP